LGAIQDARRVTAAADFLDCLDRIHPADDSALLFDLMSFC